MNKIKKTMNALQDRAFKITADEISKKVVYGTSAGVSVASILGSVVCVAAAGSKSGAASTDDLSGAQERFKTFINGVGGWIVLAGVIVLIAGVIQFGMGWMRDDPEMRSKSAFTILGGVIIAAGFGIAKTLAGWNG